MDFTDFGARIWKRPPKSLEKHYLEKVFASPFQKVQKPHKTNGKNMIWGAPKPQKSPTGSPQYSRPNYDFVACIIQYLVIQSKYFRPNYDFVACIMIITRGGGLGKHRKA